MNLMNIRDGKLILEYSIETEKFLINKINIIYKLIIQLKKTNDSKKAIDIIDQINKQYESKNTKNSNYATQQKTREEKYRKLKETIKEDEKSWAKNSQKIKNTTSNIFLKDLINFCFFLNDMNNELEKKSGQNLDFINQLIDDNSKIDTNFKNILKKNHAMESLYNKIIVLPKFSKLTNEQQEQAQNDIRQLLHNKPAKTIRSYKPDTILNDVIDKLNAPAAPTAAPTAAAPAPAAPAPAAPAPAAPAPAPAPAPAAHAEAKTETETPAKTPATQQKAEVKIFFITKFSMGRGIWKLVISIYKIVTKNATFFYVTKENKDTVINKLNDIIAKKGKLSAEENISKELKNFKLGNDNIQLYEGNDFNKIINEISRSYKLNLNKTKEAFNKNVAFFPEFPELGSELDILYNDLLKSFKPKSVYHNSNNGALSSCLKAIKKDDVAEIVEGTRSSVINYFVEMVRLEEFSEEDAFPNKIVLYIKQNTALLGRMQKIAGTINPKLQGGRYTLGEGQNNINISKQFVQEFNKLECPDLDNLIFNFIRSYPKDQFEYLYLVAQRYCLLVEAARYLNKKIKGNPEYLEELENKIEKNKNPEEYKAARIEQMQKMGQKLKEAEIAEMAITNELKRDKESRQLIKLMAEFSKKIENLNGHPEEANLRRKYKELENILNKKETKPSKILNNSKFSNPNPPEYYQKFTDIDPTNIEIPNYTRLNKVLFAEEYNRIQKLISNAKIGKINEEELKEINQLNQIKINSGNIGVLHYIANNAGDPDDLENINPPTKAFYKSRINENYKPVIDFSQPHAAFNRILEENLNESWRVSQNSELGEENALDVLLIFKEELHKVNCTLCSVPTFRFNLSGFDITNIDIKCHDPRIIIKRLENDLPKIRYDFNNNPAIYAYLTITKSFGERVREELGLEVQHYDLQTDKKSEPGISIRKPPVEKPTKEENEQAEIQSQPTLNPEQNESPLQIGDSPMGNELDTTPKPPETESVPNLDDLEVEESPEEPKDESENELPEEGLLGLPEDNPAKPPEESSED